MGTIQNTKGMTGHNAGSTNVGGGYYIGGNAGDLQQYKDAAQGIWVAYETLLRATAAAANFNDPRTGQPFTVVPFDFASGGWGGGAIGELFFRHKLLGPVQPNSPPNNLPPGQGGQGLLDYSSTAYLNFRSHFTRMPDPPNSVDGGPGVQDVLGYIIT